MKLAVLKAVGVTCLVLFCEGLCLESVRLNPERLLSFESVTVTAGETWLITPRRLWGLFTLGLLLVLIVKQRERQ